MWQLLHEFGISWVFVSDGGRKRKGWLRMLISTMVRSIAGIWQATHSEPVLSATVLRMLGQRRAGTSGSLPTVAVQTKSVALAQNVSVVSGPMHVVAAIATHSARVHQALHNVIACIRFLWAE